MTFEEVKGKRVFDTVTGFEGKVTAYCEYIDGSSSFRVERLNPDGSDIVEQWFSPCRLEVVL